MALHSFIAGLYKKKRMEGGPDALILSDIIEEHASDYDAPLLNYSNDEMSEDESDYEGDTEDF